MRRLLLLAAGLIVYGSLYPWHFDFARTAHPFSAFLASWPNRFDRFAVRDAVINLLLYAPLGMAAFLLLARRWPRGAAAALSVAGGAVLSLAMEFLQIYIPSRDSSLFDVATNTLGTAAGALTAMAFGARIPRIVKLRTDRHAAGAGLLLACWAGYQLYPFFPVVSQTRLHAAVDLLLHSHTVTLVEIALFGAEWFAAALLLDALCGPLRVRWLAVTMLSIPLRVFVPTRTLSFNELLGAVLALAAWAVIPHRLRAPCGLWALLTALLAAELAPFHFSRAPGGFSWIPFAASFSYERWAALVTLLGKAFAYGAAVWLWARSGRRSGEPHLRAGAILALALFALEWVQRYIPGRTPEITDPLLAILMALAVRATSDLTARRGLG